MPKEEPAGIVSKANINLLSCLNGRILRLPITHLDEEMSAIISKLESCSKLLVIQRRALAESFAPALPARRSGSPSGDS